MNLRTHLAEQSRRRRFGPAAGVAGMAVTALVALAVTPPATGAVTSPRAAAQEQTDQCPFGWSTEETVWFGPPRIDTGIPNPQRDDGCTLLDVVWRQEPFASHGEFVATVDREARDFVGAGLLAPDRHGPIVAAAARTRVGAPGDTSIPNSCDQRLAIQFDDGPSFYRAQTLQVLRDKQVTGVFMDTGMRVEANPQIARFQVREGHQLLNHTYSHAHLNQVLAQSGPDGVREEVLGAESAFLEAGAPISFKGIRPPFGAANAQVRQILAAMGYTAYLSRIGTDDWVPERTGQQIREAIVAQLRPGAIISLHDGPFDTPAGAATVQALALIIDAARERGYCFGKVDHHGEVVADRHLPSSDPIPGVVNPVPYASLVFDGEPPEPYVIITP